MRQTTRIARTSGFTNSLSPLFLSSRRGALRCFCAMGIFFTSIVGPRALLRQESKSTQQKQAEIIRFHLLDEGSGYGTTKRMRVSFSRFKAEDGVTVERRIQTYPSPSSAQDEMTSMVRSANQIIARERQIDTQGKPTGERLTLAYTHTESNRSRYLLLWQDGKVLHVLESVSLKHLLAFEGQMKREAQQ